MTSLFQQIKAGHLWDFHGGIHPPTRKELTNQKPIGQLNLPDRLYIPLRQHIGVAGKLLVKVGERVLKGQALTAADNAMTVPIHAPTSGVITAMVEHPSAHPSALPEPCLILEPDGADQWRERDPLPFPDVSREQLLARIHDAGIAGMGGAGFPTHIKASAAAAVDYLIINAVECEPYITADDALMQACAADIVQGIDILCQLLSPKAVLIGIEDDKPAAIAAMQQACQGYDNYLVRAVPVKYPSGGEKQLIQLLTSKEVPSGRRPLDIGIVMQNIGTVYAISQAVLHDIPLISRIVTVTGETLTRPQNMQVLLGTPVGDLLDACGFVAERRQKVIMGGPMMGFTLPALNIPVVKSTNCVLAPSQAALPDAGPELDCIRCSACAEACPASLLPQQLLWYSKAKDHEKLNEYNLSDCIECGACAYVCPSEIPLVQYYRVAKADIREQQREERKAEQAKARFEARNARLERDKQERAAKNAALAAARQQQQAATQQAEIAAAAARHQHLTPVAAQDDAAARHAQVVAERERKKAEALAYQAAKAAQARTNAVDTAALSSSAPSNSPMSSHADPRAAAVAAAVARAKAKKLATDQPMSEQVVSKPDESAQARSSHDMNAQAQSEQALNRQDIVSTTALTSLDEVSQHDSTAKITTAPAIPADPRAAAVAAAIARAKAKKQAADQTANALVSATPAPETYSSDIHVPSSPIASPQTLTPQIIHVEVNNTPASPTETTTAPVAPADPRAAAVAAAIARAKAKKAQALTTASPHVEQRATTTTQDAHAITDTESSTAHETAGLVEAAIVPQPHINPAVVKTNDSVEQDPRKAAIAAAIARAKAKKLADLAHPSGADDTSTVTSSTTRAEAAEQLPNGKEST